MAEKMIFLSSENYYDEELIEYTYFSGFAVSQKQKSIESLHNAIERKYIGKRVLEISTKSTNGIGVKLSAFNLMFHHEELDFNYNLENIFQSSKVFENGGPYRDLLDVQPKDAKRDERLKESGKLIGFNLYGESWPIEPKTLFYDWIYIKALSEDAFLSKAILDFDVFTDIEFNYKKSINCQARAAAIFVSLVRKGELEEKLQDMQSFMSIYNSNNENVGTQLSIFEL